MARFIGAIARVLFSVCLFTLLQVVGAQTPVALPYTMTTIGGGLAPASSYSANSTACPGLSSRTASSTAGDNCAAISGILGAAGRGGVAVDAFGNVFVADDVNYMVHMIDQSTGIMTKVAGTGSSCSGKATYYGDGCLAATGTTLKGIRGIGIDPYGNVLVADYNASAIHVICRAASPLCTASQVGYMELVAGCFASTSSSTAYAGVGLDNTPAWSNSGTCTTAKGETNQPRGVAADLYGNVYYADTTTNRIRVVLGPQTSNYFSGNNPLWAALKTHWASPTQGYVYTVVNVAGTAVTTGGTVSTTGSACLASVTGNGSEVYTYSGSATATDSRGNGCPYWDSSVDYKSGAAFMVGIAVDGAGNLLFTDPGSGTLTYGGLRVFYVNGAGTAGSLMSSAITKNNASVSTPQIGFIYSLAGGSGMATSSGSSVSASPVLGNNIALSDSTISKLAVSPQGNIYIGDGTKVLFYDIYNGTLRTLLSSGATAYATVGSYCSGTSGAIARSPYFDGCPASQAYWGNSNGLGLAVDGQDNLYMYDAYGLSGSGTSTGMLVRKVLAQGVGVQPAATQAALASVSTSNVLQAMGATQTQTFQAHFPAEPLGTAAMTQSSNGNYSYGTPTCTLNTGDNSTDCTVAATYTPTAAGLQSSAITLAATSGESLTMSTGGTATGSVMAIDNAVSQTTNLQTTAFFINGSVPAAIAVDGIGNLYEASGTSILEALASSPLTTLTLASGLSAAPTKIAVDTTGNIAYLNGSSAIQVLALTKAGAGNAATYANSTVPYTPSGFGAANPIALAMDPSGNLYVADSQNSATTIYEISPAALSAFGASACAYPAAASVVPSLCQKTISSVGAFGVVTAITSDAAGNIYVADSTNQAVYKLTPAVSSGVYTYSQTTAISGVTAESLATDAAGNLYVQSGNAVTMYPQNGPTSGVTVLSGITTPAGVAVDGAGNVYSADAHSRSVSQVERGAIAEDFGSDYSLAFSATLTNTGNQNAAAQNGTNGAQAGGFTLAGGSSYGCAFSNNLLAAMSAGQSCTLSAHFPAIGTGTYLDSIAYTPIAPSTTTQGVLTLKGLANLEGYNTTVSIADPTTSTCTVTSSGSASTCTYIANGTEASFTVTVTASSQSTDGTTTITAGPTTASYVSVSVDSGSATSYNFTSTSGLTASTTINLSGLAAGTHTVTVTFPQQGSFLLSSKTYNGLTIASASTAINWSPTATTQQVSAPIGTGVLNAAVSPVIDGNFAYAIGAAPSCTSTTPASGSIPVDASTYLTIGNYTLYATFCPTDATDYNSTSNSIAYTVTKASTTAAVGASTMVVAPNGGNYSTLTAALQALPATGGAIYIAPGTYSGQNVISYPNVQLRGLGGDPTQVILTGENGAFSTSTFTTATLPSGFSFGPTGKGGNEGSATLDVSKNTYIGQTALASTFTPNNFYAEYLTIQNTYNTSPSTTMTTTASGNAGTCSSGATPYTLQYLYNNNMQCGSQALALYINSDQAVLNNVNLVSQQDTLYAATSGCGTYCIAARQYMWKGLIVGDVDYVFGDAALVFDHTNFFTTWHGLTATGTETIEAQNKRFANGTTPTTISSYPTSQDYLSGFICNGCTLLSQSTGMSKLYYGRPYNISSSTYPSSYSTWVMLNSFVDQVNASGWLGWDGASQYLSTSTYGEFNTQAYTDPTPGTAPYPYALFNSAGTGNVPPILYTYDASSVASGNTYYYGNTTTGFNLAGGNTGSGATALASRESSALALTAATAAPYYPVDFLSTTVPSTKLSSGSSSNWNPVAALAQQVNAFVPTGSVGSIAYGSSVTILGRPQTPGAGVIPTGTYAFYDGGSSSGSCTAASASCVLLASGTLDASGEAYLTTSLLSSGVHAITMVYDGDTNFSGSTSPVYSIKVLAAGLSTTTTSLSVNNTSSTFGTVVTGTANVAPSAATGTVTMYLDGVSAATCTLASGSCVWSISGVSLGSHTLYASYLGDSSYGDSVSASASLSVVAAMATGDSRTVTEPSFPAVCQQLTAALTTNASTQDLDASVDATVSNIDGARIQAALNSCSGTGKAVELSVDSTGTYNAFLSGALSMPSNVTLLVDPGVTLYFSRNVQDYDKVPGTPTCGTINSVTATASCLPLIDVPGTSTNVGIMGYGKLNGRGNDALLNTFTTSGYAMPASPTWWSMATQANGEGNQQNPRFIQMDTGASNVTLYKITLINAPNFHVATTGAVSGLTVWGIKIVTPTNARNTDGVDPGNVTNGTITQSWISDGDDNVAVGASGTGAKNITVTNNHFYAGHGESIGSYTGGGVSNVLFDGNIAVGNAWAGYGSAALTGVADTNSTAIRIKTANDRGGLVTNIQYSNSCFIDHKSDLQFTPYYSSGDSTSAFPSYTNILLQNLVFKNDASSYGTVELTGEYNTNNGNAITNPLGITFDNVTFPSALASLVNSTTPAESSATSTAWGTNTSGGTGQYVNLTLGPGSVSSNFLSAYNNLVAVPANNNTLTNNVSINTLNPPSCVATYLAPELTGPNGVAQSIYYGQPATLYVLLTPAVAGTPYPNGTVTLKDDFTSKTYTGTFAGTGDLLAVTIPAADMSIGTHTFSATSYTGDSNYTVPASYQSFGSQVVTVSAAPQTITFSPATTSYTYAPGLTFTTSATASSGLSVSFVSQTSSVCTVNGTTVNLLSGGTCTIQAEQAGNTNYLAATPVSVDFTIHPAAQTIAFAPAVTTYAYAANKTFAVSATASSGLTVGFSSLTTGVCTVSGTTVSVLSGGTCAIQASQAGSVSYLAAAPVSVNFSITQAAPAVSVSSGLNPVLLQNAVTFTATVTSTAGTPTGTVNFLDGSTVIGTGTLSNGAATFTTSSLALGSHTISAAYLGDASFAAAGSGNISQAVITIDLSAASGSSTSETVLPGHTAQFSLAIAPSSGSVFPSVLTLALSGLPAGATAAVAQAGWVQSNSTTWTLAANTALSGNTTITIQAPSQSAANKPVNLLHRSGFGTMLALGLLLPFAGKLRKAGRKLQRMAVLLLLAVLMAGISACGTGSGFFTQTQKSYTVVVTVSSGALSQSTNLTLTVE